MPRRPNHFEREYIVLPPIDHAALTATTTVKGWKVPAGKSFQVTRVTYHNVTGLAEDPTNVFAGDLKNGATVIATLFNTDSDGAGTNTLVADTTVEGVLSATAADAWLDAGEQLSLVLTEGGTATLPAGFAIVEGYLY